MEKDKFVIQVSNREKIKSLFSFLMALIFIFTTGFFLTWFWARIVENLPFLQTIYHYVQGNIKDLTLIGIVYSSFLGGIFFVPSPDEIIFYYIISKNNLILGTLFATLLGYLLAQVLNYLLGWKASDYILNFVSKRQLYQGRRYINKYGGVGIYVFNLLPFPAPLLSLGLGIAKYNFKRLLIWSFLGHLTKYLIISATYLLIGQI